MESSLLFITTVYPRYRQEEATMMHVLLKERMTKSKLITHPQHRRQGESKENARLRLKMMEHGKSLTKVTLIKQRI
jgi:hypothetical protein